MTEDEQVLARLAALDAELRADDAVQADLKARAAERIRADQASGEVPTILIDDEAEADAKAQRRAEAVARLKAARAGKASGDVALAVVPAATPADPRAAARAAAIARLKAARAAKSAAAAPARTAEEDDAELEALLARRDPPPKPKPAAVAKPAPAAKAKPAPKAKAKPAPVDDELDDEPRRGAGLGDALALAGKAAAVKDELARPTGAGEKSWLASGLLSLLLGPLGWLYAGAWREAIPASAGWLGVAALFSMLPMFMMMPVMMVAMPVSAIVGVVYAAKFNRTGKRQRILGPKPDAKSPTKLKAGQGAGRLDAGKRGR